MASSLFTWIGLTDVRVMQASGLDNSSHHDLGPIGEAVSQREFASVHLFADLPEKDYRSYAKWLTGLTPAKVQIHPIALRDPNDFTGVYKHACAVLERCQSEGQTTERTFHLSPGTPTMGAVWVILAKTRFPAEIIECSRKDPKTGQYLVRTVAVPFEMSAEYLEDLLRKPDEDLVRLANGLPTEPAFDSIIHRSTAMKLAITEARQLAPRNVPVLVFGETGTGKELVARAIHNASPRKNKPFVAVNCGAIPEDLVESELFGHKKGSFTGAVADRKGRFVAANDGTLFLDEIGELPLAAQVKLLRVLQDRKVSPVGSEKDLPVNVRVVAATNRDLVAQMDKGVFREDLFYRLAVGIITVPPLRQREGDIGLLVDHFLERLNQEFSSQPGFISRVLSPGARNKLLAHLWPGNVRELENTLARAMLRAGTRARIEAEEIERAILTTARRHDLSPLDQPLGGDLSIEAIVAGVAKDYLERAWRESGGSKTGAAKLLGLRNHQNFDNWAQRYGIALSRPGQK